jgi:enediyne biosynthesis protein E4
MLTDRGTRTAEESTMPIDHPRTPRCLAGLAGLALAGALVAFAAPAAGQTFTRIVDPANPVFADPGAPGFAGASWVDADGNGRPDLFVGDRGLYLNAGAGVFTKVVIGDNVGTLGNSWADYDNDGDPDLMVAGSAGGGARGSRLFVNDGAGGLTLATTGTLADSVGNSAWACAWGDYDADGRVDLVLASAFGFTGTHTNRLLHNDGGGVMSQDAATDVTVGTAPYTVPSWCDFDLDGDLDLAIGAGPANGTKGPDFFYRNLRVEGGAPPLLDRITTGILATELRDGQIVQWPDYDNDGDLDCFITNFRSSVNHLYRNDAGTYVKMTAAQAGPIAGDTGWNLASLWHDFDLDGDLDCLVTRTQGFTNRYYRNEGNGTFTSQAMGTITSGSSITAVAADYDLDGDLDVYASAAAGGLKGLYRNDQPAGSHWFQLRLAGTLSNRSAIGAKVRVRAMIGGQSVAQIREVSSQNSFNGHSDFVQHFGLGDAASIEWLSVEWPSGLVETFTGVPVDTTLTLIEGQGLPTPTLGALVGSRITGRGVELEWYGSALEPDAADVHRRALDGDWARLGAAVGSGAHHLTYVDATAGPGAWAYRLGRETIGGGIEWLTDESWIDVPAARLALAATAPRALGGRLRLEFVLPAAGGVRVQVFDVMGRRVAAEDLGSRAAGAHTAEMTGPSLRPGVYWARLTQGHERIAARVLVPAGER